LWCQCSEICGVILLLFCFSSFHAKTEKPKHKNFNSQKHLRSSLSLSLSLWALTFGFDFWELTFGFDFWVWLLVLDRFQLLHAFGESAVFDASCVRSRLFSAACCRLFGIGQLQSLQVFGESAVFGAAFVRNRLFPQLAAGISESIDSCTAAAGVRGIYCFRHCMRSWQSAIFPACCKHFGIDWF
jgi:hypothetical protein